MTAAPVDTGSTAPDSARSPLEERPARRRRVDWSAVRAIVAKDLLTVRRSKAVLIPMLAVPFLLMVVLPLVIGLAARVSPTAGVEDMLNRLPAGLSGPITELPEREQLIVLVNGYLLAPLFLIVPLMVSAVVAADAFAGEKERHTLESLLYSSISDRDLFLAKFLSAFVPALAISWGGFLCFAVVANSVSWGVLHRLVVPNLLWGVVIVWIAPAIATLALAIMVRVSARTSTTQEANQLGGAVILPLVFLSLVQSSGLLLVDWPVAMAIGAVLWIVALALLARGAKRFTRDQLASQV